MTQLTQQPVETSTVSKPGKTHSARVAVIAVVVLILAGGFCIVRRLSERQALAKETEKLAVPTVAVTNPGSEPSDEKMVLPAQVQAFVQSAIYARTNGYLLRWTHDIGSQVKRGELLADIILRKLTRSFHRPRLRASRLRRNCNWQKALLNAGPTCAKQTQYLSRRPISRPAPTRRRRRIWPRQMPTCAAWSSLNPLSTFMRRFPV